MVELKFFGGLNTREISEILGISEETVLRDWNFAKLWLPLGALLVRVSDSIHDHFGEKACAITIDFIGELVVYEKESHEIASYANAI